MAEIELFHFRPGHSVLHRINTAAKYISAIILSIGIFNSSPIPLLVETVLFVSLAIAIYHPITPGKVWRRIVSLRGFVLFLFIITIVRGLTTDGTSAGFPGYTLSLLSREGLLAGGIYSWKLILLLLMGQLLISTTDPSELHGAIYRLLRPMPLIPAGQIATMVSLTISFIPLIFDQYLEIRMAVESRLGSLSRNPVKKIMTIALPLMQTTLSRADEVAEAMESRCYCENPTLSESDMVIRDWLILFLSIVSTTVIFFLKI